MSGNEKPIDVSFADYLRGYNDRREEMAAEQDGIEDLRRRLMFAAFSAEDTEKIVSVVRYWLDS